LLCVSSIRESLEEDVVGVDERGNESFHSLQSEQFEQFTPSLRAIRPELLNKLHKQRSAPSLFHSYAEQFHNSAGQLTPETSHSLSGSSRSLYAPSESSDDSFRHGEEDFHGNILAMNSSFGSNKRRAFFGMNRHQSMRSVVEEADQTLDLPEWLNRSCPNLMATIYEPNHVVFPSKHEDDRESFVAYTVENSTNESLLSNNRRDMILEETSDVESPRKGSYQGVSGKINHEEFILSPIGDGSVDGLFEILKGMDTGVDHTDTSDIFEPLPF
jgi:hypothetical protein